MPSFLEQINNKAQEEKNGSTEPSVNHMAGETAPVRNPPEDTPRPADSVPTAPAADQNAAPHTAQRESVSRPGGGIRSVDHVAVVDHSFFFKKVWAVILCLLLVVALAVGAIVAVMQFRRVAVKDFTGRTIAEMRKWATEYKIVLDEATVYDESATEDVILYQDITSGKIAPNAVISVTYSKGCDPTLHIDFPDVASMTGAEVKAFAEQNKLLGVKIVEENSDTVAKGGVIRYEFASAAVTEATFSRSDAVTVYVSKGEARPTNLVKMQNFVGKTKDAAQTWVATAKLTQVRYVSVMADGEPGTVIAQNIEAGTLVETDATIVFTIVGTNGVIVPDFSGMTQESAKDVSGLRVSIVNVYDNTVPFGAFVGQNVSSGTLVDTDTAVTVRYSLGRPYLEDLVGKREDEIARLIYEYNQKGAAFTYTTIYVDNDAAKGSIVAVSRGGEFVAIGEALTFSISRGSTTAVAVQTVTVSDYSTVKQSEAQAFNPAFAVTVKTVYSDTVPFGGFIAQSLPAGSAAVKTSDPTAITLTYSLGKPYMESLLGRKENELPSVIEKYNASGAAFTVSAQYVNSSEPKGTVVAASVGDEYVSVNTVITVSVSNGTPIAVIAPDYSGILKEYAADVDNRVKVTVVERYSNAADFGKLISQSTPAGTALPADNEITLTYSLGLPYLGDLEDQTEATIDRYFYDFNVKGADLHYTVNFVTPSAGNYVPYGHIVSTTAADGKISCGSHIVIYLSNGREP